MTGSPIALPELYQSGYRYALSLCVQPADAEDLLQRACEKLWKCYGGIPNKAALFRSIRNLRCDQARRENIIRFEPLDLEPAGRGPSEKDEALEAALATLKPDQREALYLMVVEGYTAKEVSKLMKRPKNSILSLVHRAKQQLRERLGQTEGAQHVQS